MGALEFFVRRWRLPNQVARVDVSQRNNFKYVEGLVRNVEARLAELTDKLADLEEGQTELYRLQNIGNEARARENRELRNVVMEQKRLVTGLQQRMTNVEQACTAGPTWVPKDTHTRGNL